MHTHHVVFFFVLFCFLAASGYAGGGVMPPHDRSAGPHWQPTNVGFMNYYWPYIDVKAWGGGGGEGACMRQRGCCGALFWHSTCNI